MTHSVGAIDPGMQNERTSLAWRRTALSLLVATATIAKVASTTTGQVVALAWLVVGVPGAVAILVLSSRSYRARRTNEFAVSPWPLIMCSTMIVVGAGVLTVTTVIT